MPDREELTRQRAYDLWDRAGRPEGKEAEHWHQAEREVSDEAGGGARGLEEEPAAPYADELPEKPADAAKVPPMSKPAASTARQKPVAGSPVPGSKPATRKRGAGN